MTKGEAMAALGSELRAQRKAAGKTVQQFAFELGISDRQLRRYERGRCFPPEFRLKIIAQLLELEPRFFVGFLRSDAPEVSGLGGNYGLNDGSRISQNRYISGSFSELVAIGYEIDWLTSEAARLEHTFPTDEIVEGFAGSNEMGDVHKWNELVAANTATAFGIIKDDQLIAYWFCLPIKEELYRRAIQGENVNQEITLADVAYFDLPQEYDFYFVDLYQATGAPPWVVNKILLDGFLNLMKSLAEAGHFIRRMCTHAYAVETERLCDKCGFAHICDHKFHARQDESPNRMVYTKMYEIDFRAETLPELLNFDDDLYQLYRDFQ